MTFLRRALLVLLAFCGFGLGTLLGVYNAEPVRFSLLLFELPPVPIGLLVIAAGTLGIVLGYLFARFIQLFKPKSKPTLTTLPATSA